ncbi:lysophospholipid acyltransferase family protein [Sunxiuqinia sp. A32]|uniref:lysophospholipid acyltransferase family protein n=1 Tax=Sunxiuqinia sp. A32 TaxID=3461496 RepID=UPI0040465BC0
MKLLSYLLSPIYLFWFGFQLLLFHPIQVICRYIGGYPLRKKSVDILNYFLLFGLRIMGSSIKFEGFEKLSLDRPLIIVSNHQSTFDIPPIVWGFRKIHPRFISKIELGKGIPSISYNLRHAGSALIDRKNRSQSVKEIIRVGRMIEKEKHAVSIFPEGTRSRNGQVKKFQEGGIHTLMKVAPTAMIVPFVIDGHSELGPNGYFPLKVGVKLRYTMLDPIDPKGMTAKEIAEKCEYLIKQKLGQE